VRVHHGCHLLGVMRGKGEERKSDDLELVSSSQSRDGPVQRSSGKNEFTIVGLEKRLVWKSLSSRNKEE